MAMRLQEVHPALVHLPIATLPLAVGADLLGRATGDPELLEVGRRSMALAAVGALASAVTGLIAQEEVSTEGESHDMLITHRNLNLLATLTATAMATWRSRREPNAGYLALGLAGIGVVAYTAYLGGKMVYEHGVGVEAADGLYDERVPELKRGEMGRVARTSLRDLEKALPATVRELRRGKVAPAL
ncbi:MAG TPA: DUF2231 domain-containing protein [Gemmatimonadaceae bacterium]